MAIFNKQHAFHCIALVVLLFSHSLFAEVLVVTGAGSPSISMNKNQVCDVFLGKVKSLPNGINATPVDQPEFNSLREEFYFKVANKSVAQVKVNWAKLYFTGRGTPPREGADSDDIKKIVNSTPGAIGYIDRSSLDSSVKVVFVAQ
ncbi:MAG: phosphate ABC transporter substrate-binding protein [Gallionella sp.]|jgi:ABC-type phosphate transport system substrate-binding protein